MNSTEHLLSLVTNIADELSNPPLVNEETGDVITETLFDDDDPEIREEWDGDEEGTFYTESGEVVEVVRKRLCDTEVYDVEYTVSGNLEFMGARLMVAGGGPNIYINTRTETVQGYWGSDRFERSYTDAQGIHEYWEEMYNTAKG
ncbi:hypothetical protein [Phaeobacter phage MD18]|nr:hypothetical protein [Phaeobacter phage MD18]